MPSKRMQPHRSASANEVRIGSRPLDLDQDYCVGAVGSLAGNMALSEGARLETLRQLLSGEDVIQLAIRLGLLAFLIYWTFLLIRPLCRYWPGVSYSPSRSIQSLTCFPSCLGGRPRLAAAILTVINLAIVIGPATWLGLSALEGMKALAGDLSSGNLAVPSPPEGVKQLAAYRSAAFTSSGTKHPTTFGRLARSRPRI